jgi:hypothetical protein
MIADPEPTLKRGPSTLEVAIGGLAAQPAVASARTMLGGALRRRCRHGQALLPQGDPPLPTPPEHSDWLHNNLEDEAQGLDTGGLVGQGVSTRKAAITPTLLACRGVSSERLTRP